MYHRNICFIRKLVSFFLCEIFPELKTKLVIPMTTVKRRKIDGECRIFKESWTNDFL